MRKLAAKEQTAKPSSPPTIAQKALKARSTYKKFSLFGAVQQTLSGMTGLTDPETSIIRDVWNMGKGSTRLALFASPGTGGQIEEHKKNVVVFAASLLDLSRTPRDIEKIDPKKALNSLRALAQSYMKLPLTPGMKAGFASIMKEKIPGIPFEPPVIAAWTDKQIGHLSSAAKHTLGVMKTFGSKALEKTKNPTGWDKIGDVLHSVSTFDFITPTKETVPNSIKEWAGDRLTALQRGGISTATKHPLATRNVAAAADVTAPYALAAKKAVPYASTAGILSSGVVGALPGAGATLGTGISASSGVQAAAKSWGVPVATALAALGMGAGAFNTKVYNKKLEALSRGSKDNIGGAVAGALNPYESGKAVGTLGRFLTVSAPEFASQPTESLKGFGEGFYDTYKNRTTPDARLSRWLGDRAGYLYGATQGGLRKLRSQLGSKKG